MDSDFRLRGYSLSDGRPVASARVGYDDPSGFYADGSATLVHTDEQALRFLGVQGDVGYAKRLGNRWSIDVGFAHNQLRAAYPGELAHKYSEAYVGVVRGPISAYVFASPNYYRPGAYALYGQLEASISPARNWLLSAHVGSLEYLKTPDTYFIGHRSRYDWRLGVQREIGNLEIHAALSGGGPGRQYYRDRLHSRTAVTVGTSLSF